MSDSPDAQLQLKKRARRRLVGAVAFAGLAAVILPMVMDEEPKQQVQDIQIRIPGQDAAPFNPRLKPADTAKEERAGKAESPAPVPVAPPPVAAARQAEAPAVKAPEKPAEKPANKPAEKPAAKPVEKPAEKPTVDKPAVEKPIDLKQKDEKEPDSEPVKVKLKPEDLNNEMRKKSEPADVKRPTKRFPARRVPAKATPQQDIE